MKIFTIVSALFLSFGLNARHAGEIEIVSHSGEQFYVVLNGNYQNYRPQSNVNFKAYATNWNNLNVVAADHHFSIEKRMSIRPNKRVTYRIVNRNGFHSLQYVSERPINQGYAGGFGNQPMNQCGNSHQQPPSCGSYQTRPPVSSCGSSYNPHPGNHGDFNPGYIGYNSNAMMNNSSYERLKKAINAEAFSDDKLSVANQAARNKRMTVQQIKGITKLFAFSDERLEFIKTAYRNCVNKSDYYELMNVLTFSSEKRALEAFLAAQ